MAVSVTIPLKFDQHLTVLHLVVMEVDVRFERCPTIAYRLSVLFQSFLRGHSQMAFFGLSYSSRRSN